LGVLELYKVKWYWNSCCWRNEVVVVPIFFMLMFILYRQYIGYNM